MIENYLADPQKVSLRWL